MKLPAAMLLTLLFATAASHAQARPILEGKGDFVYDPQESVLAHKVTGDHKLVLVGREGVRVLDFASARLSDPRPLEIPDLGKQGTLSISPTGLRLLVIPSKSSRPAAVWDLGTGRQLATLKATKPVRAGLWSGDGRTLVTSSNPYAPFSAGSSSVEVVFWDGETLARLSTLPSDKVAWWHLTADGRKCFFSVGDSKNYLLFKYIRGKGTEVSVWDVRSGKVEVTVAAGGEDDIRAAYVSPGEKYLAFAARHPKSKNEERRVLVFEVEKGAAGYGLRLKHELSPVRGLPQPGAMFSPGAKYFAVPGGNRMLMYEAASGEKKLELADFEVPNGWFNDETFLRHYSASMTAYDTATGKRLYEQRLVYETYEYTEASSYSDTGYTPGATHFSVTDRTHIRVHPSGRMFLTYSNQYVKVFDTRTGAMLQELVSPPMDYTKKKPRLSDRTLVSEAGWSYDGRTLYAIDADRRTVSLWWLNES